MQNEKTIIDEILNMEKTALDRWGNGDPSGFLEISSEDIVYFDPFVEKRIDGLQALTNLYESIRGQVKVDSYELINPKVQLYGDTAILTFNYAAYSSGTEFRWNCSEVYVKHKESWKIIQTHWSLTQPNK